MASGIHKTAQREAILNYLKDNKSHPSITDIYNHVSKQLSTISMTTVYNTMDLLKKERLVFELPMIHGEGRRFDSNPVLHDHLICDTCNKIFDIDVDIDHSLLISEEQRRGFDITETCINIYGTCLKCQKTTL
jgi:Fur family transcriptional regulator, peroxide stress response regulator